MIVELERVALVTNSDERYADSEIHVLRQSLQDAGVVAEVMSWDDEVDWGAYTLVVVRTTWDYFDRLVEFAEWAMQVDKVTTLVNPADVIRWNSHKGYLVEMAVRGVPTVPTVLIPGQSMDVTDQLQETVWDEVVVKPAVDGGARGTYRGRRDDAATAATAERLAAKGDVVVQPFVPGIAAGERSLVFMAGRLSHAVRKVPAAGDYRSQRHLGGTESDHTPDSAEVQVALAAMEVAPGRLSYARVDLVDWEGSPALMELEVIEPDLFFRGSAARHEAFVTMVQDELARAAEPAGRAAGPATR